MGKWLAEYQENSLETDMPTTDITDTSHDLTVLSVTNRGVLTEIDNIAKGVERWSPEFAAKGYVWCFDCQYFDGTNCNHKDNPFRTVQKCPQAPRKCQWYEIRK